MLDLRTLHERHCGKVSDKWSLYLGVYEERLRRFRALPIRLLEIGVQNGGSLEIHAQYFPDAELIAGCDINPACAKLVYTEPNIRLYVGDANAPDVREQILSHAPFDIIIDDGSHGSKDIVNSFCNYFGSLRDGGLYVAEDLHCSYWRNFDGGLFHPGSSVGFFKRLVDIVNFEHWGVDRTREWIFKNFARFYGVDTSQAAFEHIHSVTFINSMCFVEKKQPDENRLGQRTVAGRQALVEASIPSLNGDSPLKHDQSGNPWSNKTELPEDEMDLALARIAALEREIGDLRNQLDAARKRRFKWMPF